MTYTEIAQQHIAELYPTIVYARPKLMDLPPGAIIGNWAYSVPGKVRFILDRSQEIVAGVLPADLARAWVRDEYKLPLKRRKNQMEPSFRAPLHAVTGKHGDCLYLDIEKAYLKVLSFGYDVEYILNRYIGSDPITVPDEVKRHKFSYSIAVAMSASKLSNLQVMGKEGLFDHKPLNLYSNPCLFNLAQDALNAIAYNVLASLGSNCVYYNTDGCIVKRGYERVVLGIFEDFGFRGRVKHEGETEVYGVASWKVGDTETKRRDASRQDFTSPIMDKTSAAWLQRRFQLWGSHLKE